MFRREPGGAQTIRLCTNISCMLRGGYDVLETFERKLGIQRGQSNGDFSLVEEECIAACEFAPCAVVGTKYFLNLTPAQVDDVIAELRREPHPESEVV
jgi:NADH:ubiquinone oxidoreductase subunit E